MDDYFDGMPFFIRYQGDTDGSYKEIAKTIYSLRPASSDSGNLLIPIFSEKMIAEMFIVNRNDISVEIYEPSSPKDLLMILSFLSAMGSTNVIVDGVGDRNQFPKSGKRFGFEDFYLLMRVKEWK